MVNRPRSLLGGSIRYLAVLTVLAGVLAGCTVEGQGGSAAEEEDSLLSRLLSAGSTKEPPTKEAVKARADMLGNRDFILMFNVGLCLKGPEIVFEYEQKLAEKKKIAETQALMAAQPTGDGTVPSDEEIIRMMQEEARAAARAKTLNPIQRRSEYLAGLPDTELAWDMLDDYEKMLDDIEKNCV